MIKNEMPLEQLSNYHGTNPKPDDFDEFWDLRMKEVNSFPLNYEVKKSEMTTNMDCVMEELWFESIDHGRVYAKFLHHPTQLNQPLILQFHGYPGASRSWFEQASFVGLGYSVIAMDCPHQGGYGRDLTVVDSTMMGGMIVAGIEGDAKDMYYVRQFQNIGLLCRIVQQLTLIDQNRIYVNGASQGGGFGIACAALNPIIKKAAILYPFLSDYQRVWEMDLDQVAYEGLRYYTRWFDPMQEKHQEIFTKLGYIDVHHLASRIKCEVLFGSGLMDSYCPVSTQFAVYNQLQCQKKQVIFPDYAHEEIPAFDDLLINYFGENQS